MTCNYFGLSDPGCIRDNNEDAFVVQPIWDERHLLCVVIDGVGGYAGGEVAAEITATTITNYLHHNSQGKPLELLKQAVVAANNAIISAKDERPELSQMGCVCTASLIDLDQRQLSVVHIGDTRLYRIERNVMTKLTHDHSLVGYREEIGELTETEAMNHPNRNVIERYLGEKPHQASDPNFIDAAIFPIGRGETLLYCSDGLYDMLTSAEITSELFPDATAHVTSNTNATETAVRRLIHAANAKGGEDNITVVIVAFEGSKGPTPDETHTPQPSSAKVPSIIPAQMTTATEDADSDHDSHTNLSYRLCFVASLSCLLLGLLLGIGIGSRKQSSIMQAYTDSLSAMNKLADSLRMTNATKDSLLAITDSILAVNDSLNVNTITPTPTHHAQTK
ncbi:MAG: protein phosphatase 2C domain-containing protein [Prevotella sp.]|nr:protein phosphatase 2C domain-containing protein [Prevotella sp.]